MKGIENKTIIEDLDHLKEIEIVVRVDKKNTEEVVKILGILSANKAGEANKDLRESTENTLLSHIGVQTKVVDNKRKIEERKVNIEEKVKTHNQSINITDSMNKLI